MTTLDNDRAHEIAVLIGALEERICSLKEWEDLRKFDTKLWTSCDDGYESVSVYLQTMLKKIDSFIGKAPGYPVL